MGKKKAQPGAVRRAGMAEPTSAHRRFPTVPDVAAQPQMAPDILLDWRFNLALIAAMEILLILFALPKEITTHRQQAAQKALWRGDYRKAYTLYYDLERADRNNAGYLKGIADARLGLGYYDVAIKYYVQTYQENYTPPDLFVQIARAYWGLAQAARDDPKRQAQCLQMSRSAREKARVEWPNDLKVNYWLGWLALDDGGDLIKAASHFGRVRRDAIPAGSSPTEEEERLIKEAEKYITNIRAQVFKGKDYPLDISGIQIVDKPIGPEATTSSLFRIAPPTRPTATPSTAPATTPIATIPTAPQPTSAVAVRPPAATPTPPTTAVAPPPMARGTTKTGALTIAPARPPSSPQPTSPGLVPTQATTASKAR